MGKSLVLKVLDKQNNLSKFSLLVAFAFFVFLLSSLVFSQIIIKEKVKINPQTINPDYQISTLDPCPSISRPQYYQSVYSCSGFPIEPYQQLYPFQSSTFLTFNPTTLYEAEIISGTDYAYFERGEYIDSAGNFFPYETFGTLLSGLTGAELSGTGDFIGYEGAGTFERENSTVYRVRFDNYSLPEASVTIRIKNLNDNSYTDWHTLIVNPDLRFVNQQYEADTLLHYYSKDVTPKFMNANSPCSHPGYGGCPPDNVTFNIEIIEGQQFGSIKNSETSETATSFTGLSYNKLNTTFTYYANGEQPDSTSTVKIRHSSSDADIIPMEFSFTVKKNNIPPPSEGGSIFVKMDKKVVIPGDTVNVQLLWIDEVNDTVEFSQIQRFKVDLAEGSEYGIILDAATGDTSDTFTEMTNEFKVLVAPQIEPETAKIVLVAEADLMIFTRPVSINNGTKTAKQLQKNSIDKVDGEGGTNTDFIIIGNHLVGVGEITITKTPFIIEIVPALVSAGDTAQIIPMKLNSDGTTTPFDSHQTFELGMLDGCALGYMSAETDSNNYFYEVKQPFYFIADTSADSGSVNIRVGVIDMKPQNRSLTNNINNFPESDNPVSCANVSFVEDLFVTANLPVEKKYEILLGETKWYQVKYTDLPESKLVIDELSGPDYWNGKGEPIKQDVWGDNPVSPIPSGDKLGVYWEKEKPVWDGNVKKGNLPIGLIRLVGRYWEDGKTYKVKLTAHTTNGDQASIEIEVKRPSKLGVINNIVKDVFSNDINIDNLCIINSGKLGLPPQIIKGHIEKETTFRNSFRYEPRLDIIVQKNISYRKKYLEDFPYYTVTANSMGSIPMPNNHNNVRPVPYVTAPIKISNYLYDNIGNYIRRAYKIEGKWFPPFFVGFEKGKPTTMLVQHYNYALNELNKDRTQAMDYAISELKKWLLTDEFIDGKKYAQTRIFSSYGMLQQVFYFACTDNIANYSINNEMQKPESLNEFDYVFNAYRYKMGKKLSSKPLNQWLLGFEEELISFLQSYNSNEVGYGQKVINFSIQYLPKN